MIQPYEGYYFSLNWKGGFNFTGNDRNANLYQIEWRSFHGLSKRNPSHLLAFWFMGDFAQEGTVPYMILPATAYDQRGKSSRGYTQGRFRGNNPFISLSLFESIRPSYGFGLRVKLDKYTRTNLTVDLAFGEQSMGFYLAVSETF